MTLPLYSCASCGHSAEDHILSGCKLCPCDEFVNRETAELPILWYFFWPFGLVCILSIGIFKYHSTLALIAAITVGAWFAYRVIGTVIEYIRHPIWGLISVGLCLACAYYVVSCGELPNRE